MLLLVRAVLAQDYSFPTSAEDYAYFYPTAYYDHSGSDWNCGSITYSGHRGSDFGVGSWSGMKAGRDITAATDGTVTATNDGEFDECSTGDCDGGGGYGNYVKLQHSDGRTAYYAHMKQWTVAVSTGQSVACGQKLGEVGSSGYSTGPHLHFEIRESSGSQTDPFYGSCSSPPSYWYDQGSYDGLPGLTCDEVEPAGPCEPVAEVSCGDEVHASNDASGSTDEHSYYGCTKWTYTGPEIAYSFATDRSETVSVAVTGLGADLDIVVLEGASCDGGGCVAASDNPESKDESLSFDASAGHVYAVVLDGWEDATSDFTLSFSCEGSWPGGGDDSDEPVDSGDSGTDETPDTGEEDPPEGDRGPHGNRILRPEEDQGGCGCGGAGVGPWGLAAMALGIRRRRGRSASRR